ncbi:hypothetical protein J0H58_19475 [bacterium]|nr:hypothetical protein [bacterium]
MNRVAVYSAERDAGLDHLIRSTDRVVVASAVHLSEARPSTFSLARLSAPERAVGSRGDFDLQPLDAVLVTTGWNRNDDVFDPVEVWAARKTPDDKPLNYEHDDAKIVGHIVGSRVTSDDGTDLGDETVVDDLPAKFHVVTAALLYKHWQTPELQQRMDTLLAEIAEGKWFVSMECLFKGFDYALKAADGTSRVVARNETTAFLSKHLRAYGGSGQYGDSKVGRVLRNIVFSGKGLVKNPANPESVILDAPAGTSVAMSSCEALARAFGWEPGLVEMTAPGPSLTETIARHLGWDHPKV